MPHYQKSSIPIVSSITSKGGKRARKSQKFRTRRNKTNKSRTRRRYR